MATARSGLRRRVRQRIVQRADFAVAYGARSADYLRGLRSDLPLVIGRNSAPVPDTSLPRVADATAGKCVRFVLIGDLADTRKGVDVALAALRLVPDADLRLSVIGGGRLLGQLSELGQSDPRVRFLGPLAPHECADELRRSDVLLFPTRVDVFGLALVEAMGAEVAPIVSRAAGATDDLAVDRQNALVVDGHEPEKWAAAIELMLADPDARSRLAKQARATIEGRWTMRHSVGGMIAGLRLGVWARKSKAGRV